MEEFRQLLQQSPESAPAHILAGEALDGLSRTSEAIAEFQAAAKIAPNEPNVHSASAISTGSRNNMTKPAKNSNANWLSTRAMPSR